MSPIAIIMMVVAILILWGGLVASIFWLRARPEVDIPDPDIEDQARSADAPLHRDT